MCGAVRSDSHGLIRCGSISHEKRSCHTRRTCCQGNLSTALMNRRTRTVNSAVGRRKTEIKNRGYHEESAIALLRKGICRLWTNGFVRERPVPFLKPRPTDAFRDILCFLLPSFYSPSRLGQTAPGSSIPAF